MKIVLTTTIAAILAIGLLGINNNNNNSNNISIAFAQEGFTTESLVNETIALGNTSQSFNVTDGDSVSLEETTIPEQIRTNATLAFAQEGAITPEGMNNTMSTENATQWTANATLAFAQ